MGACLSTCVVKSHPTRVPKKRPAPPPPLVSAAGWSWRAGRGRPPSPLVCTTRWNQQSQFDFLKVLLLFKHCILSRSRFAFSVPSWSRCEFWNSGYVCVIIYYVLVLLIDTAFPPPTGESTATPENDGLPDPEGPIIAPSPGRLSINPLPRALGPLGLKRGGLLLWTMFPRSFLRSLIYYISRIFKFLHFLHLPHFRYFPHFPKCHGFAHVFRIFSHGPRAPPPEATVQQLC